MCDGLCVPCVRHVFVRARALLCVAACLSDSACVCVSVCGCICLYVSASLRYSRKKHARMSRVGRYFRAHTGAYRFVYDVPVKVWHYMCNSVSLAADLFKYVPACTC